MDKVVVDGLHHLRSQAQGGLVHHEQLRLCHHPSGDGQDLLLAAREHYRQFGHVRGQDGKAFEHRLQPLAPARPVPAEPEARQFQVLADREGGENAPPLGHLDETKAHPGGRRDPSEVAPQERQRARAGLYQSGQCLEDRALAGAIGAQQGDDLALVDAEADFGDPPDGAVVHSHAGDLEDAHRRRRPR